MKNFSENQAAKRIHPHIHWKNQNHNCSRGKIQAKIQLLVCACESTVSTFALVLLFVFSTLPLCCVSYMKPLSKTIAPP